MFRPLVKLGLWCFISTIIVSGVSGAVAEQVLG